jgi:crotonobetainyl-CoA:carnitine CoA-transferase CaiB-like acyl-CoA transferase
MNKGKVILSLEQALALPYATQRFAQLGWRVIRIESPAEEGQNAGDPNRYIGAGLGFHDLHSYYIAPNIGKQAITLNLKKKEGRELLLQIIRELHVDVFMCNTLPKRYKQLGIDFDTLRESNPDLIWCGISAMGPGYPDRAGYDPALQALLGYTYMTGDPAGTPVPCGIPVIDLKAGDEAFTQVVLAMLEQKSRPGGKEIHISMAQCAASWLVTALPQLNFVKSDDELFIRSGNEHRSFIPCNVYPTSDGFVYLAIGNDSQWARFTTLQGFESLAHNSRRTNEGRMRDKENIYKEIGALTMNHTTDDFVKMCLSLSLSVSPVNSVKEVAQLEFLEKSFMKTRLPEGKEVKLFPPSHNTAYLEENNFSLQCAPRLGEHNEPVLSEIGLDSTRIESLRKDNVI